MPASAMDKFVAKANIEHYRRKLAQETDETKRQVLARLLAEAKLASLTDDPQKKSGLMTPDATAASGLGARQFVGRFLRRSIRRASVGTGTQVRTGRRGL